MKKPDPAIVLVADTSSEPLRQALQRYAGEYRVESADSLASSLPLVQRLLAGGVPIAMLIVESTLPDASGLITMDCLQALSPTSKRVVFTTVGDYLATIGQLRTAMSEGRLDLAGVAPRGPRDEELHAALTDLLSDWGWSSGRPVVEALRVVAPANNPDAARIHDFLDRLGMPHGMWSPESPPGREVLDELGEDAGGPDQAYPVVRMHDAPPMVRPTMAEIGAAIYNPETLGDRVFDVAIVGGGPAGLGAAVYGASEGLETVVIDADAIGGQAGSSSMIRNYLGFPNGISGMRLTQRARFQALRFGAKLQAARPVQELRLGDPAGDGHVLQTPAGEIRARSVIIATGVKYRRLGVPALEDLVGLGVHYGAATSAARDLAGLDVHVVGGGNSAGQAAMHLSRYARSVTIVIRRPDLTATMSDYLIREIVANARITVRGESEVIDGGGNGRLEWLTIRDNAADAVSKVAAGGLFLLLGANPHCGWLPPEILLDEHGFVLTGRDVPKGYWRDGVPPASLATTAAGVFAVGDVRAGSMKRVAAASGEGSSVVPLVHGFLAGIDRG